jgi:hypothetical protein
MILKRDFVAVFVELFGLRFRCRRLGFWLERLPVADDRSTFAGFAGGLGDVLDDKPIVAVLVGPVSVVHEGQAEVGSFFSLVEVGLIDFCDVDVGFNHDYFAQAGRLMVSMSEE